MRMSNLTFNGSTIEKLTEKEFAALFHKLHAQILKDPIRHFIKNENFINFQPSIGQSVFFKLIFGQELNSSVKHEVRIETSKGVKPEDFELSHLRYSETELYEYFTEFPYKFAGKGFNRINLIIGRRGSKTTLASILALFFAIKTNWKPYLSKTPIASVVVLSHTVGFSQEVLDIIKSLVDDSPILSRLKDRSAKNTQSEFNLKMPFLKEDGSIEYSRVAIKVGAASKRTTRGRAVCVALCDEIAWWEASTETKETDAQILRALRPALGQFGEHAALFKLSSPLGKNGILYEEWQRRNELREDYVQLKTPSWSMNPIVPDSVFAKDFRDDVDGFDTEYRAIFAESISNFIQPEFVDGCIVKNTQSVPPDEDRKTKYYAAIDAAFKSDRFAFTLIGDNEHRLTQYSSKVWQGSKGSPVEAFEVAKYISIICRQYGVNQVSADQFAFQPLKEIFRQFNINLVEQAFTLTYKKKVFFSLKRAIHNNSIDLLDIPLQTKEIKELQVEQAGGGQVKISHVQGGHDDTACALAIAVHTAFEKGGEGQITFADISNSYVQPMDIVTGRTYTAPKPELLAGYRGFEDVVDNSNEWTRDAITGELVKISELEDEDSDDGPNFSF